MQLSVQLGKVSTFVSDPWLILTWTKNSKQDWTYILYGHEENNAPTPRHQSKKIEQDGFFGVVWLFMEHSTFNDHKGIVYTQALQCHKAHSLQVSWSRSTHRSCCGEWMTVMVSGSFGMLVWVTGATPKYISGQGETFKDIENPEMCLHFNHVWRNENVTELTHSRLWTCSMHGKSTVHVRSSLTDTHTVTSFASSLTRSLWKLVNDPQPSRLD